jgi:hypothetical protein
MQDFSREAPNDQTNKREPSKRDGAANARFGDSLCQREPGSISTLPIGAKSCTEQYRCNNIASGEFLEQQGECCRQRDGAYKAQQKPPKKNCANRGEEFVQDSDQRRSGNEGSKDLRGVQ